jgi:hypothetical protein
MDNIAEGWSSQKRPNDTFHYLPPHTKKGTPMPEVYSSRTVGGVAKTSRLNLLFYLERINF